MRVRSFLTVILIVGAMACGEATDRTSSDGPTDETAPATLEDRRSEATSLALRLQSHEALKPVAGAILDTLESMGEEARGAGELAASPAPLPLSNSREIARRIDARAKALEATADSLVSSAKMLDDVAAADARRLAEALVALSAEVARARVGFEQEKLHEPDPANLRESDVTMRGGTGARGKFDAGRIYHGDPSWCEKPAVVDLNRIYRRIPEYREIREKGLEADGPRYYFLLLEAGKAFRTALRRVAARGGYDVIGGLGAIVFPDREVPEITDEVIAALPE